MPQMTPEMMKVFQEKFDFDCLKEKVDGKFMDMLRQDLRFHNNRKEYELLHDPDRPPMSTTTYMKNMFDWLAPELRRHRILPEEHWVPEHAHHALHLFDALSEAGQMRNTTAGERARILNCAVLISVTHKYGWSYLREAPILAAALATAGTKVANESDPLTERGRIAIARGWVAFLNGLNGRAPKLREVMAWLEVPYGLRAIAPAVVQTDQRPLYKALEYCINPSELAQAIPKDHIQQAAWFAGIRAWAHRMSNRHAQRVGHDFNTAAHNTAAHHIGWAIRNLGGYGAGAGDLADYAFAMGDRFQQNWSLARVIKLSDQWHEQIARSGDDGTYMRQFGIPFDQPIAFKDPAGYEYTIEAHLKHQRRQFTFVRMRSGVDMYADGKSQHHCVANYCQQMVSGDSLFYSMRDEEGKRLATIQYRKVQDGYQFRANWPAAQRLLTTYPEPPQSIQESAEKKWKIELSQAKGPSNAALPQHFQRVVEWFGDMLNKAFNPEEEKVEPEFEVQDERDDEYDAYGPLPPGLVGRRRGRTPGDKAVIVRRPRVLPRSSAQ